MTQFSSRMFLASIQSSEETLPPKVGGSNIKEEGALSIFRQNVLKRHNMYRARHGAKPLKLDKKV